MNVLHKFGFGHNRLKTLQLFIIFSFIISVVLLGLYTYNQTLRNDLSESTFINLEEIMQQQKFNFTSELSLEIKTMKSIANATAHMTEESDGLLEALSNIVRETNFDYITLADTNGDGIVSSGHTVNIYERDYFKKSLRGETVLSKPFKSSIRDAIIIAVSTPIIKDNKITGILVGSYDVNKLNNLFLSSFSGKGYAFVIDSSGDIIAQAKSKYTITNESNLFDSFHNRATFLNDNSVEKIISNISEHKTERLSYTIGGEKRYAYYAPLGINNWYIFSIVPEDIIAQKANSIIAKASILTFTIVLLFMIVIINIFKTEKNMENIQSSHINELSRIAYIDELTGCRNYAKFKIDAQALLNENTTLQYMFIKMDIDKFKLINETFGYEGGDKILINVSKALQYIIDNRTDIFARINTDEFIIMLKMRSDIEIMKVINSFKDKFNELIGNDIGYKVIFPMGRYVTKKSSEANKNDINKIFEKVNYAHRMAKKAVGDKICDYDGSIKQAALREKEIENKMEEAILNREFKIFLQAKYRLSDETIAGAEALVRWKTKEDDIIYPNEFIPLFEKNGFITKLDMYMLESACSVIREWIDENITPVTVSVNFSRMHLNSPRFIDEICSIVEKYNIPRNLIEIELTETAIYDNEKKLNDVLDSLHKFGFTLSMDDFGTGYSSLGLLKNLPVDVIKLDRAFFINSGSEFRAKTVISSIMDMAKKLKIHTVAEGVETKEQVEFLRELGCDIVQGYYFAKPIAAEELKTSLKNMSLVQ